MTNRLLIALALALITAACGSPDSEPTVVYKKMTIPADRCGILQPADGVNAIRIGATPEEMGASGCAPKDVGVVRGCRIEDTDIEFIVSEDFTFYTENATLEIYSAETCLTQGK